MEEILSVKHLEKHYAGFDLDASFALRPGQNYGIYRPQRRGKDHRLEIHAFPCASRRGKH